MAARGGDQAHREAVVGVVGEPSGGIDAAHREHARVAGEAVAGGRLGAVAAIIRAAQAPEDTDHIAQVIADLKRIESKVDRIGPEVEFAADAVMEQFIVPKVAPAPERAVRALLAAMPSAVAKSVLLAIATRLGLTGG